ncbi:hypothetical protein J1C56_01905 [Aminobacter anthyllidis]|uniref:GcrA cell cycle regulator n=1 Tax=Aminobacter anthyllidis TaxID=1035067 RepID=A0A9X1D475_9HYPH|nr:GcrA family cell cycle regulator [Aminobacter anthyllidis]MBT1154338.1 hypothetical protein [Aminobacter anthyllidis]
MLAPSYQPHEIVKIGELLKDRKSASQIAAEMSAMRGSKISRNAIIGKVHRHPILKAIGFAEKKSPTSKKGVLAKPAKTVERLKPSKTPDALLHAKLTSTRAHTGPTALPARLRVAMSNDFEGSFMEVADLAILTNVPRPRAEDLGDPKAYDAESRGIPLLELARHDCRWPVNDAEKGAEHLFCGRPSAPERPYCRAHSLRAVQCR